MTGHQEVQENYLEEQRENNLLQTQPLLEEITLPLTVQLGEIRMSLKEIGQLRKDQIIELHKDPESLVELYVDGKLLGKGELVDIEGELGVKIIELL